MKYPEKEKSIWTKELISSFESQTAISQLIIDEALKLLDYPGYFDLMNLPLPSKKGITDRLIQEKIIKQEGAKYLITSL